MSCGLGSSQVPAGAVPTPFQWTEGLGWACSRLQSTVTPGQSLHMRPSLVLGHALNTGVPPWPTLILGPGLWLLLGQ